MLVLRYAFHELRFQKYNIRCLATNQPMVRHATRLGCQAEGRIRRHIYTEGQYHDELIFGLTREEFDALLARLEEGKRGDRQRSRTAITTPTTRVQRHRHTMRR